MNVSSSHSDEGVICFVFDTLQTPGAAAVIHLEEISQTVNDVHLVFDHFWMISTHQQ